MLVRGLFPDLCCPAIPGRHKVRRVAPAYREESRGRAGIDAQHYGLGPVRCGRVAGELVGKAEVGHLCVYFVNILLCATINTVSHVYVALSMEV